MTNELEKDGAGSFIIEFVSGGPKHYGYRFWSEKSKKIKTVVKVKGFRIDHESSAIINFDNMRRMVHSFVKNDFREETPVLIQRIERNKEHQLMTVFRKKVFRITYDKRIPCKDFTTIPYGYKR